MKVSFILFVILISGCAASSRSIHLRYEGESYYPPLGVEEIGVTGGSENFLVLKYSREKGRKYLAFTNSEFIDKGSCSYSDFFNAIIQKDGVHSSCEKYKLEIFRDVFTSYSGAGYWRINGLDHYYFITERNGTFVFKVLPGDKIIKIDSDFLGPEELYFIFQPGGR